MPLASRFVPEAAHHLRPHQYEQRWFLVAIEGKLSRLLHKLLGTPTMNSINQNQPEMNYQDLQGPEAVRKIQELVKLAENCFFCSSLASGSASSARPMNVRQVDDQGQLWFLSASDSHLNSELATDPVVRLFFQGSKHSDFLQLTGHAQVSADPAKIKTLWEPILKTWFTGGIDDPRIRVIQVTPTEGYYWDTKHGMVVASFKMLLGSMLGTTLDDSIEGELRV